MKSRTELKNIFAVAAIIASFLVAIGLAFISNNRETYWVATRDMTPGHMVDSIDFKVAKGSLSKESRGYIRTNQSPIGYSVSRFISAGEYLNASSLVDGGGESGVKLLSFAVAAPDLPANIRIGDAINLYQVVNDSGDGQEIPSKLIIEGVFLVDLNRKSENLGGLSIITVAIPDDFVERALNATRRGRMVVVINHG